HTHTIIFLHGRGSTAVEFASDLFESQDSSDRFLTDIFPSVKWVFPCAAECWARTSGEMMHQWFDMASVQRPQEQGALQREGLEESVRAVTGVVEEEVKSVPAGCIFLAGISQGCATGILALLCLGVGLGGFVGLSSWLPFQEEILRLGGDSGEFSPGMVRTLLGLEDEQRDVEAAKGVWETPVFLSHSEDDEVVPVVNGQGLADALVQLGMKVQFEQYADGGHWVNEPRGVDDMVAFIEK
ncbi:alpha/beta-hydrolase, partial [Amniculicola lignicola CBS 123094]